ncbi:zinc-ribbon domain-containing protein [uncultured Eubacterium sp.]|nr:zinc-ribbon domain-containing protein [uncultured Eubacterium sp.]
MPEWSEKNLPLTPDKITFGSNKRVWWKRIYLQFCFCLVKFMK